MSTERIAEDILALRGNPRVAAAAVFSLIGTDPRFVVDGSGVWSLSPAEALSGDEADQEYFEDPREFEPDAAFDAGGSSFRGPQEDPGTPRPRRYRRPGPLGPVPGLFTEIDWAVVDVETTGGSHKTGDRVIEIAAVLVSGGRIVDSFSSLVNPGRPIPRMITRITGIDDAAVVEAPAFEEIAPRLAELLGGRIFTGHNVGFDWGFVSAEMERATGRILLGRRFCTLKVARRLLPQLPSRSLGSLADYFGIGMDTHHRALDDAKATAQLLLRFLDTLTESGVNSWRSYESFLSGGRRKQPQRTARPTSMDRE
jgi:DNA polymerase-3 subunit epsilon